MQRIADGIYYRETHRFVNIGVVEADDGCVVIDTPMLPSLAVELKGDLEALGGINYILFTDHLEDHIMGSLFMGGDVIAHDGTSDNIRMTPKAKESFNKLVAEFDEAGAEMLGTKFDLRYPNLMLFDRLTMYLGDRELEFIHLPGHTPHNVGLYVPDTNVLFAGDTVVNDYRPYLGTSDISDWVTTLRAIQVMDVEAIVPGRGEVMAPEELDKLIAYLQTMEQRIKDLIDEGASRDDVVSKMMQYFEEWPIDQSRRDDERNLYRQGTRQIFDQFTGRK